FYSYYHTLPHLHTFPTRRSSVLSLAQHNLKSLLDAGCRVSVNTDDPPYFNGYTNDNLVGVASALELSDGDVYSLLRNGFQGSFADRKSTRLNSSHVAISYAVLCL